MKHPSIRQASGRAIALAACLLLTSHAATWAGPGAHGPNGEHIDGPTNHQAGGVNTRPRLEARSELFELVVTLSADELSMLIHRFQSNEPVLQAEVEVESGSAKAKARFHADHGDYAIDDTAFLKAVSSPGPHALVITVRTGDDADLLDGTLIVGSQALAAHDHGAGGHAHGGEHGDAHDEVHGLGLPASAWAGLALVAAAGVLGLWWRRRAGSTPASPATQALNAGDQA